MRAPRRAAYWMPAEATAIACAATTEVPEPAYTQSVERDQRCPADARAAIHSRPGTPADSRRTARTAGDVPTVDAGPGGRSGLQLPAGLQRTGHHLAYCAERARLLPCRAADTVRALDPAVAIVTRRRSQSWPPIRPSAAKAPLVLMRPEAAIALPALSASCPVSCSQRRNRPRPLRAPEAVESCCWPPRLPCRCRSNTHQAAARNSPRLRLWLNPRRRSANRLRVPPRPPWSPCWCPRWRPPWRRRSRCALLPFAMTARRERAVPSFNALVPGAGRRANRVRRHPGLAAPQPIATLAVAPPGIAGGRSSRPCRAPACCQSNSIPTACAAVPVARPEWNRARPALLPPRFLLAPGPGKVGRTRRAAETRAQGTGSRRNPEHARGQAAADRAHGGRQGRGRIPDGRFAVVRHCECSAGIANWPARSLRGRAGPFRGQFRQSRRKRPTAARQRSPRPREPVAWVRQAIARSRRSPDCRELPRHGELGQRRARPSPPAGRAIPMAT